MTDWKKAQKSAEYTAKWATTMTKVRIRKTIAKTKWQLVTFTGPQGKESVGIVDMVAIRKDHRRRTADLKRGDLLEIILIQIKGGSAPFPSKVDVLRLHKVGKSYHAKAILLAQWIKGRQVDFFVLKKPLMKDFSPQDAWIRLKSLTQVFY